MAAAALACQRACCLPVSSGDAVRLIAPATETLVAIDHAAAKKILAQIDRDALAQLGCDLASIPSPTGQEKAIAEYILAWFAANGIKAVRQDVAVDRPNAVGIVKGDGTGLSLGFNGHTDTSFTGTSADLRMVAGIEPDADLKGRI